MRAANAKVLTSCSLLAVLALPPAASADQITIRSGFLQMQTPQGHLSLVGDRGFSLEARPIAVDGYWLPWQICSGECGPGMTVSLGGGWATSAVSGQLTFDGRTYNNLGAGNDGAPQAIVVFDGSFVTPPLAPTAVVAAPFVFSGSFTIPVDDGLSMMIHTLTGSGTATISLREWGSAFWNVDSVRYEFVAPQPVPEPGTMLLVGFGTVMIGRRLKRRRTD
jgi:hypothetical protein